MCQVIWQRGITVTNQLQPNKEIILDYPAGSKGITRVPRKGEGSTDEERDGMMGVGTERCHPGGLNNGKRTPDKNKIIGCFITGYLYPHKICVLKPYCPHPHH